MRNNIEQLKRKTRKKAPHRRAVVHIKRYIPLILILIGCLIIAFAFFTRVYSNYRQEQLVQEYEDSWKQDSAVKSSYTSDISGKADDNPNQQKNNDADALQELNQQIETEKSSGQNYDIELLGVLSIPKIDLTVAIGEGTDNSTLKYAVGHFDETALPGETGNCCIAGHRNYTWGKFFNRLDEVEVGDEILVESNDTNYTYKVTDTLVVNPEDTWVLNQTEDSQITLITCTPIYSATQRLIIRGVLNT